MESSIVNQEIALDTKTYRQYAPMLKKAAFEVCKRSNLDRQDAMSRAHEIFVESVLSYDFSKAKFSTHLRTNLMKMTHLINPLLLENQERKLLLQMSMPKNNNTEDSTLEDTIGNEDKAFAEQNLWDWMDKCSTADSKDLAWQILFGEINHDKENYELNKDVVESLGRGRPKKGTVVVKGAVTKARPIRTDITAQDCFDSWGRLNGWSLGRTTRAFNDLRFVLSQMKGV